MSKKISRREFLRDSALIGLGLASTPLLNACAPAAAPTAAPPTTAPTAAPPTAAPTTAPAAFDWKRFAGEHIEALLIKNTQGEVLVKYQKEFEELTGITVGVDLPPEQQQRQKLAVEFASGQTSFDVVYYSFHVQKRLFGKNKWVADLRDYLNDPTMVAPDFDWDDFSPAGKTWSTEPDGRIDAISNKIDYGILYCNKEIFAAKDVPLPKTFDDILAAAQKLHDPSKNIYGFVGRGLKNANVYLWMLLLMGWGIDAVDSNLNLNTTTPEAIESAKMYQTLLKDYSPPGAAGFNWNESQSVFALGQAAMWMDGLGFAAPLEDPNKSKVVGKVAYVVMPKGPKVQRAGMTGDGMGISSFSKKKGPAWYYCMWATSKLMQARSLAAGAGSPPRISVYNDPEALKNLVVPKEWVDTVVASSKIGHPALPIIVPVTEFRDIFGVALNNMIAGADVKTELEKATEQFKPILEKSEKA